MNGNTYKSIPELERKPIKPDSFINNLWLGEKEDWSWLKAKPMPSLESLRESEWCQEFEDKCFDLFMSSKEYKKNDDFPFMKDLYNYFIELCHNRMILGAMRYGLLKDQNFKDYNLGRESNKRYRRALDTENSEGFIDAWNMLMLSYIETRSDSQIESAAFTFGAYQWFNFPLIPEDDGEHSEKS